MTLALRAARRARTLARWPRRGAALSPAAARRRPRRPRDRDLLATLDVEVDWFDERDEEFPATTTLGAPWPAHIRAGLVDAVEAEVARAPPGAYYLVLTHEHALDLRIAEAILRRGDFAFCGLIGSRTKRASFMHRLAERGIGGRIDRAPDLPDRRRRASSARRRS